jgi:hypothetical protein
MYRDVWQKYFERYDVFLMPTTFTAAFPHDHRPIDVAQVRPLAFRRIDQTLLAPREVYFRDFDSAGPADEVCDVAFPINRTARV